MPEIPAYGPEKLILVLVDDEDADLACYTWRLAGGKAPKGEINHGKYAATSRVVAGKKRTILLHRVIAARMGLIPDPLTVPPQHGQGRWSVSIDHDNGDKFDCRRGNLKLRDRRQQMTNPNDGLRSTNRSGFRGVSFVKGRERWGKPWMASITENGKTINLGWYATAEDAAEARRSYEAASDREAWRKANRRERELGVARQRGVVFSQGRYYARAFVNGRSVHLGGADTAEGAVAIRRNFLDSPDKDAWLREHVHREPQSNGSSGYRGVTRQGKRWRAQAHRDKKWVNLGVYDTPEEAAAARRAWDEANAA